MTYHEAMGIVSQSIAVHIETEPFYIIVVPAPFVPTEMRMFSKVDGKPWLEDGLLDVNAQWHIYEPTITA